MPTSNIIKHALVNSLLTLLYVILVATFMYNAEHAFGTGPSILFPIGMLTLFVFSASVCASLIFGRPLLWYLDGQKREALRLFAYTLGFFISAGVIVVGALVIFTL